MEIALTNPQKCRKLNDFNNGFIPLNSDVLEILYIKFIIVYNMPLYLVKNPEFKAFILYLNLDMNIWLNIL